MLFDLVRMTTSTTGTGTITLTSAVSGFKSFADAGVADGELVSYAILNGSNRETGWGQYTVSGTTLTRNVINSTNSDALLNLSGTSEVFITPSSRDLMHMAGDPQGRLTLTADTPIMTADALAQTTIRYTPHNGQFCPVYNGYNWTMMDMGGELTQATTDSTKSPAAVAADENYDIFFWDDGGTPRISRGPAWDTDTSRGTGSGTTELERVKGRYVNKQAITNGPAAQRGTYLGTVRSNGSSQIDWRMGSDTAGGTAGLLHVWNYYNRLDTNVQISTTTATWTYSSTTFRVAENSTGMRVKYICGVAEEGYDAVYNCASFSSTNNNSVIGLGHDSTSTPSGSTGISGISSGVWVSAPAFHRSNPEIGSHYVQAIEKVTIDTVSVTFYGDHSSDFKSGLIFSMSM